MPFTLKEIAKHLDGSLKGDPHTIIYRFAPLEKAKEGDLSFVDNEKLLSLAENSKASALILKEGWETKKNAVYVQNPRLALAKILQLFSHRRKPLAGVHPTAILEEGVKLGKDVSIGAYTYISSNVHIGDGTIIYPLCYIGENSKIGKNVTIYAGVVIYDDVEIGDNCIIHSGTVIGADGFGYVKDGDKNVKIPHIGKVIIEEDVEIGANTTIDRATMGETRIGRGTKIDNLVQIAHNVEIGENSIIVAQVGISGSVKIGKNVTLAGQAGIADHLEIGDGATIAAQAGVIGNVPANSVYSGYPARPHSQQMRILALLQRLPELVKSVEELKEKINQLEKGGNEQ
ncbi:UDP-3-O-(3-hydroxymyristoyl)glucosamine N-acyltransferase [bacterium]|nr:UDP-3-O-(3-hydroxymyristoyl)glucosamine N-acyltransferase [bacterium]